MIERSCKVLIKGQRRIIPFHPPLHSDDQHYTTVMVPYARLDRQLARYVRGVHILRVRRDAIRTVYLNARDRKKNHAR